MSAVASRFRFDATRESYLAARPFAHCVIDDFFEDAGLLEGVLREWPKEMLFKSCSTSEKYSQHHWSAFGEKTTEALGALMSEDFCADLSRLTGIEDLVPDPNLLGGGLHMIAPGGWLNVHADFNWSARLRGVRRVNLLLYLNRDWKWNGELLLTDGDKNVFHKIAPIFNRCVIFNTTEESFHGHPEPLDAPRPRKSIAMYYYTLTARPKRIHSTIYL